MKAQCNVASFVLRFTEEVWQDGEGEPHVAWRGHIRHVQGGEEVRFTEAAQAIAFIHSSLVNLTLGCAPETSEEGQAKVLEASSKLWGRLLAACAYPEGDESDHPPIPDL